MSFCSFSQLYCHPPEGESLVAEVLWTLGQWTFFSSFKTAVSKKTLQFPDGAAVTLGGYLLVISSRGWGCSDLAPSFPGRDASPLPVSCKSKENPSRDRSPLCCRFCIRMLCPSSPSSDCPCVITAAGVQSVAQSCFTGT